MCGLAGSGGATRSIGRGKKHEEGQRQDAGMGRGGQVSGPLDSMWLMYSDQDMCGDHPGVSYPSSYTCAPSSVRKHHGVQSAPTSGTY